MSGPHPTISNLNVILTDTGANSSLILLCSGTGTPDTTTATFQKGCIFLTTDVGAAATGTYINTGTSTTPVWSPVGGAGLAGANSPSVPLFLIDNGSANALVVTAYSTGTVKIPLSTGLMIGVRIKNSLQAGANTINFNGTTKNIVKGISANNITTTYVAGSVISLVYTPGQAGGAWRTMSDEGR